MYTTAAFAANTIASEAKRRLPRKASRYGKGVTMLEYVMLALVVMAVFAIIIAVFPGIISGVLNSLKNLINSNTTSGSKISS